MKRSLKIILLLALSIFLLVGCAQNAVEEEATKIDEPNQTEVATIESDSAEKTEPEKTEEQKPSKITIVDNVGRTVEIPYPIQKAAVALRYNNELIRACGAIEQVAVVDMNTAQDREYWAEFDPEKTIGKSQKKLNYESIINSGCDVLILPSNGTYEEAEEKLADFDIPVVVISGYDTANFETQIDLIGKMFDREKEAAEFKNYYVGVLKEIAQKLEGVEKKTVYWESTKEFKTSFPGNYYYHMIVNSGGENIFADGAEGQSDTVVTPEEIIKRNPDVIVKNITPDKALSGSGVYDSPALEQRVQAIKDIESRPGWDTITAVKNGDVYVMSQFGHGGASKIVGAAYMAKWLYPEALKDFNPDDVMHHWLETSQKFKYIDGHFYPRPWDDEEKIILK